MDDPDDELEAPPPITPSVVPVEMLLLKGEVQDQVKDTVKANCFRPSGPHPKAQVGDQRQIALPRGRAPESLSPRSLSPMRIHIRMHVCMYVCTYACKPSLPEASTPSPLCRQGPSHKSCLHWLLENAQVVCTHACKCVCTHACMHARMPVPSARSHRLLENAQVGVQRVCPALWAHTNDDQSRRMGVVWVVNSWKRALTSGPKQTRCSAFERRRPSAPSYRRVACM